MTDPASGRPIVAELGRPETPQETWERKAESSRLHRKNQTGWNLILALAASLGLVLALVAVVAHPNSTSSTTTNVDYRAAAAKHSEAGVSLAAPKLPSGYSSNRADLHDAPADGVDVWTVGLITPDNQYIGLHQGIGANPTWVSNQLDQHAATGTRTIDGTRWTVYDRRSEGRSAGNNEYALVTTFGKNTIILAGTADSHSFRTVASRVATQFAN